MKFALFSLLWLYIGFVSSVDVYHTVLTSSKTDSTFNKNHMIDVEENPISKSIMNKAGVPFFCGLKMFLTIIVLKFLDLLFKRNIKVAFGVISGVSAYQTYLLLYLHR